MKRITYLINLTIVFIAGTAFGYTLFYTLKYLEIIRILETL